MRAALTASLMLAALGCATGGDVDAGPGTDAAPRDSGTPTGQDAGTDAGPDECPPERCNGADDDCDGEIDEEAIDETDFYRDFDEDGVGTDLTIESACEAPDGFAEVGGDCNDGNALLTPGRSETCDGTDDDCSGTVDDGASCPLDCTPVPFGGHGYLFCAATATWDEARTACEAAGLVFVRVDTMEELDFLWATASRPGGIGEYWIGGRLDDDGADTFTWADGTDYWEGGANGGALNGLFGGWESDQPSTVAAPSCVRGRGRESGLFHNVSCAQSLTGYVCERSE